MINIILIHLFAIKEPYIFDPTRALLYFTGEKLRIVSPSGFQKKLDIEARFISLGFFDGDFIPDPVILSEDLLHILSSKDFSMISAIPIPSPSFPAVVYRDRILVVSGKTLLLIENGMIKNRYNSKVDLLMPTFTDKRVFIPDVKGNVHVLNGELKLIKEIKTGYTPIMKSGIMVDIDGDNRDDYIIFTKSKVHAISSNGDYYGYMDFKGKPSHDVPLIGNIDNDGSYEIVIVTVNGKVILMNPADGTIKKEIETGIAGVKNVLAYYSDTPILILNNIIYHIYTGVKENLEEGIYHIYRDTSGTLMALNEKLHTFELGKYKMVIGFPYPSPSFNAECSYLKEWLFLANRQVKYVIPERSQKGFPYIVLLIPVLIIAVIAGIALIKRAGRHEKPSIYITAAKFIRENKLDDAIKVLKTASGKKHSDRTLKLLVKAYTLKGEYELALPLAEKLVERKPYRETSKEIYHSLAEIYSKTGDIERAIKLLEDALKGKELDDTNKETFYMLGKLYEEKGDTEKAKEIYKQFVIKLIDYKDAQERYKSLKTPTPKRSRERILISPGTATVTDAQAKRVVEKRYKIIEKLGEGGMGIVYKAKDERLDRIVTLKIMKPELAIRKREKEKFLREARIVAKLEHPGIVRLYDVVEEKEDMMIYLVFEFLEGRSLAVMVDEKRRLPYKKVLRYVVKICDALSYAHGKGVVHRDIKPSNIMIDKKDNPKLLDFGIARVAYETYSSLTGRTSGTPAYMSPEQHLGVKSDARTDIYSLGVTMYEAITGELPFRGPDFLVQKEREIMKKPSEIVKIPQKIEKIIMKCLKSKPEGRYQSAEELRKEILKADDTIIVS